jgi:hypothetical protein
VCIVFPATAVATGYIGIAVILQTAQQLGIGRRIAASNYRELWTKGSVAKLRRRTSAVMGGASGSGPCSGSR